MPGPVDLHRHPPGPVRAGRRHGVEADALTSAPLTLACALVGGLGFAFVGGVGAAVSLKARTGKELIAVIPSTLFTPLAIFGGGAITSLAMGLDWRPGPAVPLSAYSLIFVATEPHSPWPGRTGTRCREGGGSVSGGLLPQPPALYA